MKTVSFQIPDEIYDELQKVAAREGKRFEVVAAEFYSKHGPRVVPKRTLEEKIAARKDLLKLAGCFDSGDPNGSDNDRIDADLLKEYGSNHDKVG